VNLELEACIRFSEIVQECYGCQPSFGYRTKTDISQRLFKSAAQDRFLKKYLEAGGNIGTMMLKTMVAMRGLVLSPGGPVIRLFVYW
jgi:hypothetical protein